MNEEEIKAIEELKEEISRPVEVPEDKFDTFILYNIENAKTILNLISKLQKELDKSNERIDMCIELLYLEDRSKFDTKQEILDDIDRLVEIDKASHFKYIFPKNECIKGYYCEKVEEENE